MNDAGSAQDVHSYTRVAKELGHEVVVYGLDPSSPFRLSKDVASADAVVFIFEWTTQLRYGDALDLARLLDKVPRKRRIVIDCDGAYNDALAVEGDYNHKDAAASRLWVDTCDSLADRVYQPTLHPLRPNVGTFFFHGYDPGWERPLDLHAKPYGMVYVGHSKFRWRPMERVLRAIEPNRERVGRLALVGHGWDALPYWAKPMGIEDYFYTDQAYLQKMQVEFVPPVPSEQVIPWMSKAVFSPVIYRPLFSHLRLVTCRTFETPAANTLPLFGLSADYVQEIYGDEALELVLPDERPEDKILDMVSRPERYAGVVRGIRQRLAAKHSYEARVKELIEIVHG
jgi:glycosyltransferase involved in cell wall biosynthesis